MNEDTSGNVASLQEEIRKLKILLQQARGIIYCIQMCEYNSWFNTFNSLYLHTSNFNPCLVKIP